MAETPFGKERVVADESDGRIDAKCSMHATCLELLKDNLFPGARVLDVGSGSGYLVAVMAEMVGKEGQVTGIEHIPELTEQSKVVLDSKKAPHWPPIEVLCGDGRLGYPPNAPYDAIHVGAASPEVPDSLIEQLNPGGKIVIPVGLDYQGLMLVEKDRNGKVHERNTMGVMYVPLTDKAKQLSRW